MRKFFGPKCIITISSCRNFGKLSALSYARDSRLSPSCDSKAAAWTHYWIAKAENKRKITQKNCGRRRRCKGNTPTPFIMFTFNKRSNQDRNKCVNFET